MGLEIGGGQNIGGASNIGASQAVQGNSGNSTGGKDAFSSSCGDKSSCSPCGKGGCSTSDTDKSDMAKAYEEFKKSAGKDGGACGDKGGSCGDKGGAKGGGKGGACGGGGGKGGAEGSAQDDEMAKFMEWLKKNNPAMADKMAQMAGGAQAAGGGSGAKQ